MKTSKHDDDTASRYKFKHHLRSRKLTRGTHNSGGADTLQAHLKLLRALFLSFVKLLEVERGRNVSYLAIHRCRRSSVHGGGRAGEARVGGGGGGRWDKEERGGTAGRVREVRARVVKRVR